MGSFTSCTEQVLFLPKEVDSACADMEGQISGGSFSVLRLGSSDQKLSQGFMRKYFIRLKCVFSKRTER